ncbi:hypothetical protein TNCV_432871 [Trichonephila clavipes]|nr:hypothetical protein TNCV_432871 [Trichonephila clavipes]
MFAYTLKDYEKCTGLSDIIVERSFFDKSVNHVIFYVSLLLLILTACVLFYLLYNACCSDTKNEVELKDIAKNGFQKCFDDLYKPWQKCVNAQESYFEGGCVAAI